MLTIPTLDDSVDEADSEIKAILQSGASYTLGRISARLRNDYCPSLIEFSFDPTAVDRVLPNPYRFLETNVAANGWKRSSWFPVTLDAGALMAAAVALG